ncbi:MAG: MMPL family transporter, partial [Pseudohongiellaceae bacterium]
MSILAFMGFTGIPLDIMSITIAAIIIGIGVDDAIHYLHRFRQEFTPGTDVRDAVKASHASIGDALYYTSFTIIIGFSVLGLSKFMPTVYFGLLAALAMLLALLANLTILPSLLIMIYGRRQRQAVTA